MPHSQPKRDLTPEQFAAVLGDMRPTSVVPVDAGSYNTLHIVTLTDGTRVVVKVPPDPALPCLRYERGILRGEADFYRHAAAVGVPVPDVVRADLDHGTLPGGYLVMSEIPGVSWDRAEVTTEERPALRRELAAHVAALHTVTGPAYGYPGEGSGPLAASWREAFTAMIAAILADAADHAAPLPLPLDEIRAAFDGNASLLDAVTRPALVHFDLWDGNILVHDGGIAGLIDGERMFWGDPLADFASLALFGDIEDDADFLAGYAEAGGAVRIGPGERRRLALYRAYLYLLILVESVPRGYPEADAEGMREFMNPHLVKALDAFR
ncbi:phosphotransferase family protein [Phytomonospora endophytica]|uniref:Aminoglycoside phosphotransferase (APT) family kinase protein n=1 Tax=Phytomonospora endophytica TaxID=714109 RepID=A0A841FQK7_9ACTN|nr:aminoglycoside phosphotransferase family protein [Phytomonospora endophytica]MBB6034240.1 aminoglycoside phosphotransferase (APT) family kinase protein [Phytomonospora endophytica]GIG66633.1 phosphotransferase [Phytomonospora endophytica]